MHGRVYSYRPLIIRRSRNSAFFYYSKIERRKKKMNKIKVENWNGYKIRFVEVTGEWWAVLKDITDALSLRPKHIKERLPDEVVSTDHIPDSLGRIQEMLIVNELGIYEAIFSSRKKEAQEFKAWVYDMLRTLREASGLEGFQIFRMLDKEHQKEMMDRVKQSHPCPSKRDYIKANTIADKAVSTKFGYPKMLKKENMTPDMLMQRQSILEDTVELMAVKEKYEIDISVSENIYKKYTQ